MKNSEEPAFPVEHESRAGESHLYLGLTKREYFAIKAFQGLLTGNPNSNRSSFEMAGEALNCADSLLKQLE